MTASWGVDRSTLACPPRPRRRREPGLDGLRGVAVALVLLFHGGVGWSAAPSASTSSSSCRGSSSPACCSRSSTPPAGSTSAPSGPGASGASSRPCWCSSPSPAAAPRRPARRPRRPRLVVQLALHRRRRRLLRGLRRPVAAAAHVVARRRGAVVPAVAAAAGGPVPHARSCSRRSSRWAWRRRRRCGCSPATSTACTSAPTRARRRCSSAPPSPSCCPAPDRRLDRTVRRAATAAGAVGAAVLLVMAWRVGGTEAWLYRGGHLLGRGGDGRRCWWRPCCPTGRVRAALSLRPLRAVGRVSYGALPLALAGVPLADARADGHRRPVAVVRVARRGHRGPHGRVVAPRRAPGARRRGRIPRPRLAVAGAFAASVAVVVAAGTIDIGTVESRHRVLRVADGAERLRAAVGPRLDDDHHAGAGRARQAARARPARRRRLRLSPSSGTRRRGGCRRGVEPVDGFEIQGGGILGCGLRPDALDLGTGEPEVVIGAPVPCTDAVDLWRWTVARWDADAVVLGFGAWEVFDRTLADGTELAVGTRAWAAHIDEALEDVVVEPSPRRCRLPRLLLPGRPLLRGAGPGPRRPAVASRRARRVAAVNEVFHAFADRHPERVDDGADVVVAVRPRR